jgi:hypothetical protein
MPKEMFELTAAEVANDEEKKKTLEIIKKSIDITQRLSQRGIFLKL